MTYFGVGHVVAIRIQSFAAIRTLNLRQRMRLGLRLGLWRGRRLCLGHRISWWRWLKRRMNVRIVARRRLHLHGVEMGAIRRHHVSGWGRAHHIRGRRVVHTRRRRLLLLLGRSGWAGPVGRSRRLLELKRRRGGGGNLWVYYWNF
jgi:hypothetical protein